MPPESPTVYTDRMNASDALLWRNERDPMLRSTILSVLVLDRPPNEDRFRTTLEGMLGRVPRLRQRVVLDPLHAAPPRWERDPHFRLDYHVRRMRAPGKGTLRDLLDLAAPIGMQAFDRDRPLWELDLVDGLEDGRFGIVMKIHHSISDGVGLVHMTSSLVERSRDAEPTLAEARETGAPTADAGEPPGPFEEALGALRHRAEENLHATARAARFLRDGAGALVRHPLDTLEAGRDALGSLGRLLRPVSRPLSPLMTGRSLGLRLDTLAVPVEELKRAGKAVGGTLNDAFVGAVTGGLRLYHERHGRPADELRMTMPINVRHGDRRARAGNQFVPARMLVPVAISDPAERMREIHRRVAAQREEKALPLAEEVSAVLGRLPGVFSVTLFGSMLKAIDFVTSNVPGPPFPVYASGALVEAMIGFGPLTGASANLVLFSYDGQCRLGIATDPAAVPDPELFVECLERGLAEVQSV